MNLTDIYIDYMNERCMTASVAPGVDQVMIMNALIKAQRLGIERSTNLLSVMAKRLREEYQTSKVPGARVDAERIEILAALIKKLSDDPCPTCEFMGVLEGTCGTDDGKYAPLADAAMLLRPKEPKLASQLDELIKDLTSTESPAHGPCGVCSSCAQGMPTVDRPCRINRWPLPPRPAPTSVAGPGSPKRMP